jgi:hypothetical protein
MKVLTIPFASPSSQAAQQESLKESSVIVDLKALAVLGVADALQNDLVEYRDLNGSWEVTVEGVPFHEPDRENPTASIPSKTRNEQLRILLERLRKRTPDKASEPEPSPMPGGLSKPELEAASESAVPGSLSSGNTDVRETLRAAEAKAGAAGHSWAHRLAARVTASVALGAFIFLSSRGGLSVEHSRNRTSAGLEYDKSK